MAKKTKKAKKGTKKTKTPANRDSELAQALTNTKLWQHKLQLTERQRDDYRDTCKKLAAQNEVVTNALFQATDLQLLVIFKIIFLYFFNYSKHPNS